MIPTCSHSDHSDPDRQERDHHPGDYFENGRWITRYYPCPMRAAARKAIRDAKELDAVDEQKERWRE